MANESDATSQPSTYWGWPLVCLMGYGIRGIFKPTIHLFIPSDNWCYFSYIAAMPIPLYFLWWRITNPKFANDHSKLIKKIYIILLILIFLGTSYWFTLMSIQGGLGELATDLFATVKVQTIDITKDPVTTKAASRGRTSINVPAYCVNSPEFAKGFILHEYCGLTSEDYQKLPEQIPLDFKIKQSFMGTIIAGYELPKDIKALPCIGSCAQQPPKDPTNLLLVCGAFIGFGFWAILRLIRKKRYPPGF